MRCALLLFALVLGGCASGGTEEQSKPPLDLLRDAGFKCSAKAASTAENFTVTNEVCSVEGEEVELYTFKDTGAIRNWYSMYASLTCSVFPGTTFYNVEKGLSVISPQTKTLADKIADGIDADVHEINC